jgi:UDP:flavonoid glycosyltransferase YjiC (YdhE family)
LAVVFFISGHGFGHASREVEIVNALARQAPDVRLIIRSAVSPSLLQRTVRVPYELRSGACDSGIVQTTSVAHDDEATTREAIAFYSRFPDQVRTETAALREDDIDVVVSDIPPVAFEVAERLSVPSIAIANFTWDWIYETHAGLTNAAPWLVPAIRQAYAKAALALELPFAGGFEIFPKVQRLPLVARQPARLRDDTRRHFGVPLDRPAALLSFGGYGMPTFRIQDVDCRNWTLVATDRVLPAAAAPNVVHIDEARFLAGGFRYEDLVAAVDVVVTKPGFGIIAECIACRTAMLYTSRGAFREYDVLVREMPRYLRCRFIDQEALFEGRWRDPLESLVNQPTPPETIALNGAELAAGIIAAHLRT